MLDRPSSGSTLRSGAIGPACVGVDLEVVAVVNRPGSAVMSAGPVSLQLRSWSRGRSAGLRVAFVAVELR